MSVEQYTGILLALAAVLGAVAKVLAELRAYHHAVNSKMDALLLLTAKSARAEGKIEGQQKAPADAGATEGLYGRWSARKRRGTNDS